MFLALSSCLADRWITDDAPGAIFVRSLSSANPLLRERPSAPPQRTVQRSLKASPFGSGRKISS
jgi:hypothetical protein